MKVAIIGSRGLNPKIEYIDGATSIISGGAIGVDQCAKKYATQHSLPLTEILPNYDKFKRGAPIVRNKEIVDHADYVIAFWDKKSRGTKMVIDYAIKKSKKIKVIV